VTDVTDLTEIFSETLARVRARMDQDANAGLATDDPDWVDTREGSFYWDMTQPPAMECARLWDAMTETIAAAFPSTAWGDYLDEHGTTFGLTRNPATSAVGSLTFLASAPTLIAAGTQASAVAPLTGDVQSYQTTASGTSSASLPKPTGVAVVGATTGGTLAAGTRYYHVTALNAFGETTGSADVSVVNTGTTSRNTITWNAVSGATSYNVYVTQTAQSTGQLLASVTALTYADTGAVSPNTTVIEPTTNTTSGITLAAQALTPGTASNVAANAVTSLDTVLPTVISVFNPNPMQGGQEEESDDDFRLRILGEYVGTSGGGNVTDYRRWAAAEGVARTAVIPVWNGAGTVLVVAMNADGTPVAASIVTTLQQFLDPTPGLGQGQAPIGATVTVVTSAILTVTISATVVAEKGYSLDGTNNTIATRQAITAALATYVQSLQPGDTIIYEHVQAAFFVTGVHKVNGLTVNGGTADITLAAGASPQVAQLGTVTLTDG
jgi:uncharacterized phage protein gp47/JayE